MRTALAVIGIAADPSVNLQTIENAMTDAASAGARLIVLPEAALTGLVNNDDPKHDLPLGQEIPGPATASLATHARRCNLYAAIGVLERDGGVLYDSAVLLCPSAEIGLHYRRIQPQWHSRRADPSIYRQGGSVGAVDTDIGRIAMIVCGDLFDDEVIARVREAEPNLLLIPFARCFDDGSYDQQRWDQDEQPEYLRRAATAGCHVLMVNYLSGRESGAYFGGALAVSPQGEIIARLPLGVADTLFVDLPGIPGGRSSTGPLPG
ncbi:MAG: carbon-nitrogen hydrolase family protein [Armatimonadota bacterium]